MRSAERELVRLWLRPGLWLGEQGGDRAERGRTDTLPCVLSHDMDTAWRGAPCYRTD